MWKLVDQMQTSVAKCRGSWVVGRGRGSWVRVLGVGVGKCRGYPYLSYRREINETDVNYTCNLQKVWDSSDSLNGNSCSLFIFIRSTIPMISRDFLTRWNAITLRKGREKDNF